MQIEGIYRVNGNQADIGLIEQKVEESKYKTLYKRCNILYILHELKEVPELTCYNVCYRNDESSSRELNVILRKRQSGLARL